MQDAEIVAIDTEAAPEIRDGTGWNMGISVAFELQEQFSKSLYATYFPIRHTMGSVYETIDKIKITESIESLQSVIFHNAKFDLVSLSLANANYENEFWDTMLMAHMINENLQSKELDWLCQTMLGTTGKKREAILVDFIKKFGWADVPSFMMYEYAENDAVITLRLWQHLKPLFDEQFSKELWDWEQKFTRLLVKMEGYGIKIDQELSHKEYERGTSRMDEIVKELGGLRPSSRLDLERLLILELGLPVMERTPKGEPSFNKVAMDAYDLLLEDLGNDNQTAKRILEFRGYQKTTSSNYKPYLNLVSPDGRIRPNYKIHGTVTGRLSCATPNLQQIPRISNKPWNGNLKAAFVPMDGYTLWEADFSQLEFRIVASPAYGNEKELCAAFNDPTRDVFTEMSKTLGMTRHDTKTITYTILYGGGINRISKVFRVSTDSANQIRNKFFGTYRGIHRTNKLATMAVLKNGYIKYWTGRRRHFLARREQAHMGLNAAIQGGAAEVVKRTMIRLDEIVNNNDCRMLLQVHDSVVFEIKNGLEDYYLPQIKEIMEDVKSLFDFGVQFRVSIHVWGTENEWQPKIQSGLLPNQITMSNAMDVVEKLQ